MKLLTITRLYWPHVGGVEKDVRGRNKVLLKKGFEITTLTEKYDSSLKGRENIDGEQIYRFSYPKIKFAGLLTIWLWLFRNRELIKKADIVHIHDVFVWYLPFRFLFPRKKVFSTFHGWEGAYPVPVKNKLLRQLGAKLSTDYICGGKFIEKYYGIKADKVVLAPFDVPKRVPALSKKDKKKILYVGRLDRDTGLSEILKSLNYLADFQMDFCGDGPMMGECQKYGKVHGFTDPKPYYKKAFIVVSPGYNSIMEALSYKCLVVTTYNNPLKRDYLTMTPFIKWIVVADSPWKMAREIKYFSKNPRKAGDRVEAGYAWMKGQTWEKFTDQYQALWGLN